MQQNRSIRSDSLTRYAAWHAAQWTMHPGIGCRANERKENTPDSIRHNGQSPLKLRSFNFASVYGVGVISAEDVDLVVTEDLTCGGCGVVGRREVHEQRAHHGAQ